MPDQIKALEDLNQEIALLRAEHQKSIEGRVSSADFEQFKANMMADFNASMDALKGSVESLETKFNRPEPGPTEPTRDEKAKAHSAAFVKYARHGEGSLTPDELKILATDQDTTGGYATSPTVAQGIIKNLTEMSAIRPFADVETIAGNEWQKLTQTGAVAAGKVSERSTRSAGANPTLGMLTIPLHEFYAEPGATQTQLDDSNFDVESWLAAETAEAFAVLEGGYFISGTGVGEPEGILTNSGVSHVASGHATEITTDGLRRCEFGIKGFYAKRSRFYMERASILAVALLTDGEGQYIWHPSLQVGMPMTIDGYPVEETPDMPTIGAGMFPVLFGDLKSGYKIVDKATVATLRDPYTSKPNVLYYTTKRVGGRVQKAEAMIKLEIAAS